MTVSAGVELLINKNTVAVMMWVVAAACAGGDLFFFVFFAGCLAAATPVGVLFAYDTIV